MQLADYSLINLSHGCRNNFVAYKTQQPTVSVAAEVLRSNGFIFRVSCVRKEKVA
jgi:hypothetical protein